MTPDGHKKHTMPMKKKSPMMPRMIAHVGGRFGIAASDQRAGPPLSGAGREWWRPHAFFSCECCSKEPVGFCVVTVERGEAAQEAIDRTHRIHQLRRDGAFVVTQELAEHGGVVVGVDGDGGRATLPSASVVSQRALIRSIALRCSVTTS